MKKLISSESVSQGHPDKVADQISDAVLDAMLAQDPDSRVACETMVTTGMALVAGEVTTKAKVDVPDIVRSTIKKIGYDNPDYGFDGDSCAVMTSLDKQSPDISQGVTAGTGLYKEQGAGDQGMMFGYACNETSAMMPLAIHLAHRLTAELTKAREKNVIKWLRPDSKSQVTVEYEGLKPVRVHTVVVSTQHDPSVKHSKIKKEIIEKIIKKVIPAKYIDKKTIFHVNPTGRFVIGGPQGDCGLTGRKIIVDTYGGYGSHGGGAFSGKDPSKVDRSATYAARWVAKNIVAAKLATQCKVQLSYAIGIAKPISVFIDTYGTGKVDDSYLAAQVQKVFDLRPAAIIKDLDLKKPVYFQTARNGHFGHNKKGFTWEKTNMVEKLKKAVKV